MDLRPGDSVMHPAHGAGTVVRIEKRSWHGADTKYYVIEMLDQPRSTVRIPVSRADDLGVRRTLQQKQLEELWEVFDSACEALPDDHKARSQLLSDKLEDGDPMKTAEVVRDLSGWQQENGRLNTACERIFRRGVRFLAMEVAAARGIGVDSAERHVRSRLQAGEQTEGPA